MISTCGIIIAELCICTEMPEKAFPWLRDSRAVDHTRDSRNIQVQAFLAAFTECSQFTHLQDYKRPLPRRRQPPSIALPRRAILPESGHPSLRPELRARLRGLLPRGGRLLQDQVTGEL